MTNKYDLLKEAAIMEATTNFRISPTALLTNFTKDTFKDLCKTFAGFSVFGNITYYGTFIEVNITSIDNSGCFSRKAKTRYNLKETRVHTFLKDIEACKRAATYCIKYKSNIALKIKEA